LKEKVKRIIESKDERKINFLNILSSHNGSVISDSIPTSFKQFYEKFGQEEFERVKNELMEDAIISLSPSGNLQFALRTEKGEYDPQSGSELSRTIGMLLFKNIPKIRQTIDDTFELYHRKKRNSYC